MKIRQIEVYNVALPFWGEFPWSGGTIDRAETMIVRLCCDGDVEGWGEASPFGSAYLVGYAGGVLSGLQELAPIVIGQSATEPELLYHLMDSAMRGHEFVKTAIDLACWDVLGKVSGLPASHLLGGHFPGPTRCVTGIPVGTPDEQIAMIQAARADGIGVFSVKLDADARANVARLEAVMDEARPDEDVYADANRGMMPAQALRMLRGLPTADVLFEQLCATYEDQLAVRRQTHHPMMLDEVIVTPLDMLRAAADRAGDALNLKVGRAGGLTRARRIRDIAVEAGFQLTIQDTCGCEISRAAVTHLSQSTPARHRLSAWSCYDFVAVKVFDTDVVEIDGTIEAGTRPGLGVNPLEGALGNVVHVFKG